MSSQKVQVSPVPELNYISPEDNKDYFILDKTWYAVNRYIKWCGINPWKRQVDENGKSTLQMIKPLQFWLHFMIVFLIMQASQWGLILYVLIFYGAWDQIMIIDSHISESKMDSTTGQFGVMVVYFLYCPFIFRLSKFGEGIVQAQEHFKYCTKKPKKTNGKISICTGMYDFLTLNQLLFLIHECIFRILLSYTICTSMQFGSQAIIMKKEMSELPSVILILAFASLLMAQVVLSSPLILYFYVYGDITAQLIQWASFLKDFMSSSINTEAKFNKVKKYLAALNHVTGLNSL